MASVTKLIFYLFLFLTAVAEGKKKSVDKIVIHVPYTIHKHHHTQTKYKVITVPAQPKKIIYLKEETQPIINHDPVEAEHKTSEKFIPPHQQSATAFLESVAKHKDQNLHSDQQGSSTVNQDQKQPDSNLGMPTAELVPNIIYKPIVLPSHNFMLNFPFKPILLQPQRVFTPKFLIHQGIHQPYDAFFPKLSYHTMPMVQIGKPNFNHKYMQKPIQSPKKVIQDSVAHSSSQVYKTIINPRQKVKSYKVKEDNQEDVQLVKHQQIISNNVSVPSLKPNQKGKTYFQHLKSVEDMIKSNPDYEYEHIGYLIIDGNSKKVVGKNFKDEIHLTR